MGGPTADRIELDEAARNALEELVRRYSTPQQIVLRAQIVLKAAQGLSNSRIAEQLGITRGQRSPRPPDVQRGDMAVADRLLPPRVRRDAPDREIDFDEAFGVGGGHHASASSWITSSRPSSR